MFWAIDPVGVMVCALARDPARLGLECPDCRGPVHWRKAASVGRGHAGWFRRAHYAHNSGERCAAKGVRGGQREEIKAALWRHLADLHGELAVSVDHWTPDRAQCAALSVRTDDGRTWAHDIPPEGLSGEDFAERRAGFEAHGWLCVWWLAGHPRCFVKGPYGVVARDEDAWTFARQEGPLYVFKWRCAPWWGRSIGRFVQEVAP